MIKLFSDGQEVQFSTTIFPDQTSQVWKVDRNALSPEGDTYILWLFESEAELVHVVQLARLLQVEYEIHPDLVAPYLPYGRQDKDISNEASFALEVVKDILYNANICRIESFDPHSKTDMVFSDSYALETVGKFHSEILNHDVICYPDKGARDRYGAYGLPTVYCEKVRNQQTGEILGLNLVSGNVDIRNKRILIIDDICDGGMTFIKVAEVLKTWTPHIDLAVSHGLFSKGKQVLHDAGIVNIFTTNSLLRNPEGFQVW